MMDARFTLKAAAIMLCGVMLAACEWQSTSQSVMRQTEVEQAPDRLTTGVDFIISEDGLPRVRIQAASMAEYEQEDSTYIVLSSDADSLGPQVLISVFDSLGNPSATIQADQVRYYRGTDQYEAQGQVVVTAPDDRRLESEHLALDEPSATIRTPGFVRITTPDEQIQGYELEADEDLSFYKLARVTGQVIVRE
jgi:LPS export ABC transporter protein LptC